MSTWVILSSYPTAGTHLQVSPADITRLEKRIRSINGMAQIQQVERAQIGVEYVLGIGGFELETVDKEVSSPPSLLSALHTLPFPLLCTHPPTLLCFALSLKILPLLFALYTASALLSSDHQIC